ncbi:hypothetical protein ACP6PL_02650 [Dapis sp. BLCC M126]|uniref:hypothetical protein n=1 Tax=Dapis sp. BLCC M126 TaxID=3400189 RepID=UPI003CEDDE37
MVYLTIAIFSLGMISKTQLNYGLKHKQSKQNIISLSDISKLVKSLKFHGKRSLIYLN